MMRAEDMEESIMLDTATVTLPYKEFKELVDRANRAEKQEKEILELEEKLENRDEIKVLDSINDTLLMANNSKTAKQKQAYIRECLEIYCKTFNISIEELLR